MHILIDALIIASVDVSSASVRTSSKASADASGQIWWLLARCDSQDSSMHDSTSVEIKKIKKIKIAMSLTISEMC